MPRRYTAERQTARAARRAEVDHEKATRTCACPPWEPHGPHCPGRRAQETPAEPAAQPDGEAASAVPAVSKDQPAHAEPPPTEAATADVQPPPPDAAAPLLRPKAELLEPLPLPSVEELFSPSSPTSVAESDAAAESKDQPAASSSSSRRVVLQPAAVLKPPNRRVTFDVPEPEPKKERRQQDAPIRGSRLIDTSSIRCFILDQRKFSHGPFNIPR